MTLEEKNIFRVPESTVYSSINVYKWVLTVYFINIIFNEKEKSKQKHPFLKLKFLLCKKKKPPQQQHTGKQSLFK